MGFRDTLRQAKQAMSPEAIKQGLDAARNPPTAEEMEATLAQLTPEQRAAYDANMAQVAAAQEESYALSDAMRVLDGPAGDFLYGKSAQEQQAILAEQGIGGVWGMAKESLADSAKGIYGGDLAKHEKDRELAARIGAEERAQRDAAKAPYLAPERWPVQTSRIATRGGTQVEEVAAFLQSSGLSDRPDLVYGVYRVPDRISPAVTPSSEKNRVVEWDVVHSDLPGAPGGAAVVATYFPALEQWVARRPGDPSVLDEDLGAAFLARAGIPAEGCLGIARLPSFVEPKDRWFSISDSNTTADGDSYPVVPVVEGVLVFHTNVAGSQVAAQMSAEAPLSLGPESLAGIHTEVLNWRAIAKAVHPRIQHPPAAPSPFPYLPSTPQELIRAHLEVVGVRSFDTYSVQATIDQPFSLFGRVAMGTSNIGSAQPCADGKDRRRLAGARRVVISYRDRPEYVEGRARWDQYQHQVLQAHLERATGVRAAVEVDDGPKNKLLRAGAKALDMAQKVSEFGEWQRPPPYRYCWPPVG
jgi:hypothetical protein